MMTSLAAATIGLALTTHPFQALLAVTALCHAGMELLGPRSFNRERPPKATAKTTFPAGGRVEVRNAA